jgi:hypothetical protein
MQLAAEAEQSGDPTSARVWAIPTPYAGQGQNPWTRFLGKCLLLGLPIVPPLLAVAALVGGTYFLSMVAIPNNWVAVWFVVGYVIVVGLACLVFLVWWFHPEHRKAIDFSIQFDHWLLRRAIAARPDPLVAADDTRAWFAEMSPRRLWALGTAKSGEYNQGLLLLAPDRQSILFEGDYERYWIPASAILSCDIEALPGMAATTAAFYACVLHVRLGSGVWECPLFPLLAIEGANRWERAVALRTRIEELCGRSFSDQPAAPPTDPGPVVVG